jgi:hypothetical protein
LRGETVNREERKVLEDVVKTIESIAREWSKRTSWDDFQDFTWIYEKLCSLLECEPKRLDELAEED